MHRTRVLIMGAAGRDFHDFNLLYRHSEAHEVVAFTAAQIPDIEGRVYPPELAGPRYVDGIPIRPEEELEELIREHDVEEVLFAYSDVPHAHVMGLAARASAAGAHFQLASATRTMIPCSKPVIAVTAVRTGVGKSQTTRYLAGILQDLGVKAVAIRHPMPYGDLGKQICQRFADYDDLDRHECTIEEREEYEPHIDRGFVVYAGVDYEEIVEKAQEEAEVLLWDGGNNDTPFLAPDLHICLVDPHRPGDELSYYPGQTNFLMADVLLVNKVDSAEPDAVHRVVESCRHHNPDARIVQCASRVTLDDADAVRGKKALVIEDGPTLTHGGMSYGAGWIAARDAGAAEIVDPVPYAVGSIADTYEAYPNARKILPAMGYGEDQIRELQQTIEATPADVVVEGTPIDLHRVLESTKPIVNVTYELEEMDEGALASELRSVLGR